MGIFDTAKTALDAVKQVHDAKLQIELTQTILELQQTALTLQQENAELREQLKDKGKSEALREQLYFASNVYWRKDETVLKAYCPCCFDTKGLLVTLVGTGGCPACKIVYSSGVYARPRPPAP